MKRNNFKRLSLLLALVMALAVVMVPAVSAEEEEALDDSVTCWTCGTGMYRAYTWTKPGTVADKGCGKPGWMCIWEATLYQDHYWCSCGNTAEIFFIRHNYG